MLILLKHEHRGAFRHDKTSPVPVERERCIFRVFRPRESLCICKSGYSQRNDRRFRATGDDSVSIAMLDGPVCFSDRVCRCRTCCHDRKARTACLVPDGDVAGCDIRNHGRDEKRRYPLWSFVEQFLSLTDLCGESTDSRTHIHSITEWIYIAILTRLQASLPDGLPCRCNGIYGKLVLLP